MSLYDRVAAGNTFYVAEIQRGSEQGSLTIEFLGNPNESDIVRVLRFTGVRDYSEQWNSLRTENKIESLIGIEESPLPDGVHYEIILEEVVMTFSTHEPPEVVDLI